MLFMSISDRGVRERLEDWRGDAWLALEVGCGCHRLPTSWARFSSSSAARGGRHRPSFTACQETWGLIMEERTRRQREQEKRMGEIQKHARAEAEANARARTEPIREPMPYGAQ